MKLWSLGQISVDEKADILGKHRHLYDGYRTMHPEVSNSQPLYVQDFANDKGGLVVNNKGEVKPYTNFGINEQKFQDMKQVTSLKDIQDLSKDSKFDYTEEIEEQGGNAPDMDVDDVQPAYDFVSGGPMGGEDVYPTTEEDILDEIDEDLKESFIEQRNKITEMFNKFKKYN